MTDYWKATKKHYCKYCDLHINDDAPSKQLHESGFRHIGNKERALREIYKSGERTKKAKDDEAKEIAKIEKAAAEAHALSTGVPLLVPSSSKPLKREPPSKYDGYTTAADLGYSDPNAHLVAEQALRQLEGRIGKWEAVCLPPPPPDAGGGSLWTPNSVFGLASRKREEVESEEDGRNFKFIRREKRPVGWEEEGELAEIKVKVKEKVEGLMAKRVTKEDGEGAGGELAWKPVAWGSKVGDSDAGMGVKAIGEESVATHEDEELAKPKIEQEDSVVRPGSPMFKKRRGPPKGIGKVFKP